MNKSRYKTDTAVVQSNVLSLLDFCKGLAIAWVFLFHYEPGWFGWQGVHVFIVLSGFGLTYSCLKKSDNISWKQWYLRRFEKILPTYWLVCLSGFLITICIHMLKRQDVAAKVLESTIYLISNILLIKNLSYQCIFTPPIEALWFIPLIVSYYLVFPWVYNLTLKYNTIKGYILILLGIAAIEFIYRAISIYWLDGFPIAFGNPFLKNLAFLPLKPFNRLPDTFLVPFQLQAPFGLFLSRIAEFLLGMLGASVLVQNTQKFHNTFINYRMGIAGIFIWLFGCALVYVGLWGWVFADFIIALGLVLWVVNLGWIFQQRFSFLFLKLSQLGSWSYYIFITHSSFLYLWWELKGELVKAKLVVENNLLSYLIIKVFMLGFMIIGTWVASWLLMKFDKSKLPKIIIQKSIAILQ